MLNGPTSNAADSAEAEANAASDLKEGRGLVAKRLRCCECSTLMAITNCLRMKSTPPHRRFESWTGIKTGD